MVCPKSSCWAVLSHFRCPQGIKAPSPLSGLEFLWVSWSMVLAEGVYLDHFDWRQMQPSYGREHCGQYATFAVQFHCYGTNPAYEIKPSEFPFWFSRKLFWKLWGQVGWGEPGNLIFSCFSLALVFSPWGNVVASAWEGRSHLQGQEENKSTKINISRHYLATSK